MGVNRFFTPATVVLSNLELIGMTRLSQSEIDSQLAEPHVAHLVSIRPDGSPHVAPVWYARDGGRAWVMTGSGTAKARNCQQPRCIPVHRRTRTALLVHRA